MMGEAFVNLRIFMCVHACAYGLVYTMHMYSVHVIAHASAHTHTHSPCRNIYACYAYARSHGFVMTLGMRKYRWRV